MDEWQDTAALLTSLAEMDLRAHGAVQPCLAVFAGEDPLVLVFVRPFPPGGYHQPMIEVCALAGALGADRLLLSMSGRAWSLDDPVPPVLDDPDDPVDLRQQVLMLHTVDASTGDGTCTTVLHPFTMEGDAPTFADPIEMGRGEGWIARVLETTVTGRDELRAHPDGVLEQLTRCCELGHEVAVGPGLPGRLEAAAQRG